MKKTTTFLLSGAIVFGMTACSDTPYEPIVDGRSTPEYKGIWRNVATYPCRDKRIIVLATKARLRARLLAG